MTLEFLPITASEMKKLGWDYVDVVLVSGDAYVDHPSFAAAVIGRSLEDLGLRVAILPQPDWNRPDDFRRFGKPRLFFGISAGNVDSMINHYTAARKIRSTDEYSPAGRAGLRPDRASVVYSQLARQAYPGTPVILGGVEASLRRAAHYDFWSDTVKRSILLDSKADVLVYGMGEYPVREIARRFMAGADTRALRDIRGTAFALGAAEAPPDGNVAVLPSYEEVKTDFDAFNRATRIILENTNPLNAQTLVQYNDKRAVIINPPAMPLTEPEMDATYALPYARAPHPSYKDPIPAFNMIRESVTVHRGCFGGCGFCSLTLHQGRIIQTRSEKSIINELKRLACTPGFNGIISDLGAPTANMYGLNCKNPAAQAKCRKESCLYPSVCPNLQTSHARLFGLLDQAAQIKGIKKILINSGIRMDLAVLEPEYIKRLARDHTGGQLSVAPEHVCPTVLRYMKKPPVDCWRKFERIFGEESAKAGKTQFLVPYFIAAHPGSTLCDMIDLAVYLKKNNCRPRQVNDFIPSPMEYATAIYHTGKDPLTGADVFVEKTERGKKLQRALLQYFKPENRHAVTQALRLTRRIGDASVLFSKYQESLRVDWPGVEKPERGQEPHRGAPVHADMPQPRRFAPKEKEAPGLRRPDSRRGDNDGGRKTGPKTERRDFAGSRDEKPRRRDFARPEKRFVKRDTGAGRKDRRPDSREKESREPADRAKIPFGKFRKHEKR